MIEAIRQLGLLKVVETVPGITGQALTDPATYAEQRAAALADDPLPFIGLQFEPISNKENQIGIFALTGDRISFKVEQMLDDPSRYLFLKTPPASPNHSPTWKLAAGKEQSGAIDSHKLTAAIEQFEAQHRTDPAPWLADLLRIFHADEVILPDPNPDGTLKTAPFLAAVRWAAKHRKVRVFSIRIDGKYPGDIPALARDRFEKKADAVYQTANAKTYTGSNAICSLCRRQAPIYPNALSGAGFKITNTDKQSFFPGCDPSSAWQSAPICRDCADLIYAARWHVFPGLTQRVCGSDLLALPHLIESERPDAMLQRLVSDYAARQTSLDVADETEAMLYETLSSSSAVASITFLVGKVFGQDVKDITRVIPNVIPSRLGMIARAIRDTNQTFEQYPDRHPLAFPDGPAITSSFKVFETAFGIRKTGPAGSKYYARHLNYDDLILALLTNQPYPVRHLYADIAGKLQHDLRRNLGKPAAAIGAVRDTARAAYAALSFLHRLQILSLSPGVNTVNPYLLTEKTHESLKPLADFLTAPGFDAPEKSFAFLTGLLTGKLITIQGGRDVNPEPLRWIATSSFSERDLHAFFVRVRNKIDQYSMSKGKTGWSAEMKAVAAAIAALGAGIKTWTLSSDEAAYWFALGQTLQPAYLPSKTKKDGDETPAPSTEEEE